MVLIFCITSVVFCCLDSSRAESLPTLSDPTKKDYESYVRKNTPIKVKENFEIVTNAGWGEIASDRDFSSQSLQNDSSAEDFFFLNTGVMRTSFSFMKKMIQRYEIYPEITSAIKKINFDSEQKLLEVQGEAGILKLHSWVKVKELFYDHVQYEVIKGDLLGCVVDLYLWDEHGKTVFLAKGIWKKGGKIMPSAFRIVLKPISEGVLSIASSGFRSYIEREYQKNFIK